MKGFVALSTSWGFWIPLIGSMLVYLQLDDIVGDAAATAWSILAAMVLGPLYAMLWPAERERIYKAFKKD